MLVECKWVAIAICDVSARATCQYQVVLHTWLTGSGKAYMLQCGLWKWSSKKNPPITLKIDNKSLQEHQETVLKLPKFTQSWHQILVWLFSRHNMKLCSNMDWVTAFYVHVCLCVQEHVCVRPRAWRRAVAPPSQCSSCWWRNKIPLPLCPIVFAKLHSVSDLALSHTKDRDLQVIFFFL